jgi:septum formation protein
VTEVEVDNIPLAEIDKYIASKDPFDKAGGYGIQGRFSQWVKGLHGCYFGVVGLPVNLLSNLLYRSVGCYPDEV